MLAPTNAASSGAKVDDEAGDLVLASEAPDRDLRQDFGIENFPSGSP